MLKTTSTEERLLRAAMTMKLDGSGRVIESGEAIRSLIDSGHVRRKPESRADDVDDRRLRKSLSLFGHKVVVIEEEYLVKNIGCCVNPGLGRGNKYLEISCREKDASAVN